ncbi:NAD(P)-dependent oxidoreductase [Sphingomonas sp. 1P06PA]|uniref:NAD-dependent epimerase/dehydratase family protein n=1 Tax=Sphingomonas sp. 1P06PA TaxID=554121 RepID=UPI0039A409FE
MLDQAVAAALVRNDRHIAITGAGGWIGRATLDLLWTALGNAFDSRVTCYGSAESEIDLGDGRNVRQHALADLAALQASNIWVLHFAFQTKDRAETMGEAAYRAANLAIRDTVLDALDRIDVSALFVASSGAATKADDPAASPAMRLYGSMKRDDEDAFARWAQARGRRAVVGRIFNITGPYINKHDAYAIANFIADALAGRPIMVRAPRNVVRGYVAIRELMSLVFALLGDAPDGVVRFDSGGDALELGDVARIVADTLGGGAVVRAPITDPVADLYIGDGSGYAALRDRHAIQPVPLDRQVQETAPFIATPRAVSAAVGGSPGSRRGNEAA